MDDAAALEARQPARRPWSDRFEKALIGLFMAVVLGLGFYIIDFTHAASGDTLDPWITEIPLDDHIPFWPIWIWPYLSYFPLCFLPLVFCNQLPRFRRIAGAYMLTYTPSLIFFYAVPTQMLRPKFAVVDLTTAALDWLYRFDPGFNIFPSLHVANAVLVAWIFQRYAPRWAPLLWIEAAAITASTVLVKQHYVVDLPAGIALGTAAYFIMFRSVRVRPCDPDAPAEAEATRSAEEVPGAAALGER